MGDHGLAPSSALNRTIAQRQGLEVEISRRATPLVSVIITTRNRCDLLPRAIESVLWQDYPNREILVLDDASGDGTSDFVRANYPDIRLFRFEENRGLIAGRNFLMKEAGGEYIVTLDDDAYFLNQDAISKVVARMQRELRTAVIGFCIEERDGAGIDGELAEGYSHQFCGAGNCLRKGVFQKVGGYREEFGLRQGEEEDLALRLLEHGYYIGYSTSAIVVHTPSNRGRDFGLWHVSGPRNLLLRSWINEPFPWWLLTSVNSVIKSLIGGVRKGTLPYVLRGFGEAVRMLPQVSSIRRPVSSKTMRIHLSLRRRTVKNSAEIQKLYQSPPSAMSLLLGKSN